MNSTWMNLDQSRSNILDFLLGAFEKMWGAKRNCGKWSDMVDVRLTEMIGYDVRLDFLRDIIGENIIKIRQWMGGDSSWLDNIKVRPY